MNAPLRFALAWFSVWPLQSWVNLTCGVLLVIGLITRTFQLASVAATFIAIFPAYSGGLVLRIVSSPMVLHLRPHGRRQLLLGATTAITLVALLETLPVLVFQFAGLRTPDGTSVFDLPPLGTFQFMWGATALIWVGTFITSRFQLLLAFSWIPFGVVVSLVGGLHIPADRLAYALSVTGAAAWAGFAFWYMTTSLVTRPGWVTGWLRGQSPLDFGQLTARRWFGRAAAGQVPVSRPVALCQHLTGTDSARTPLLVGAALVMLLVVARQFTSSSVLPVDHLMIFTLFSASTYTIVRRARLVWLRAGLDRAGLFAAAELHALRAQLAIFSVPAAILVTMALVQRPDLAAGILLYVPAQLIAAICFQYAGLKVTRGWWNVESIGTFVGLGLLFLVMTITLQPHRGAFVWTYIGAIAVFGALATILRRSAARAWRTLDWRVAGPLPANVGRQKH